jgi:hypothetical protein
MKVDKNNLIWLKLVTSGAETIDHALLNRMLVLLGEYISCPYLLTSNCISTRILLLFLTLFSHALHSIQRGNPWSVFVTPGRLIEYDNKQS